MYDVIIAIEKSIGIMVGKVSKSWAEKKEGVKRFITDMKDSYIEHCNKYGMGEKYTSLAKITVDGQLWKNKLIIINKNPAREKKKRGVFNIAI